MQSVKHVNYKNIHPVFDEIESFYSYTSELHHPNPLFSQKFSDCFNQLGIIFEDFGDLPVDCTAKTTYKPIKLPVYDKKNVILCFSGGKDSTASAIKLMERGDNVYLYAAHHINPAFSDEVKCAQAVADKLGLPLYIDDLKLIGHHDYMEHPMKNMLIANGALNYGIREGIGTRIAFGNYTSSSLYDNVWDRCAGDCMEMWDAYERIIRTIIPEFTVDVMLEHLGETLDIVTPKKDIADETLSCLCRHSLRPYRHQWVKDKFGIDLLKNRCGSCFKCCVEYIYMADHDLIEYSEEYYKYCMNQLYKYSGYEGEICANTTYLWNKYFFYPMEESKLYPTLKRATLYLRKICWENPNG